MTHRIHPRAVEDMAEVLAYTLEQFGIRQYGRYETAIQSALEHLIEHPNEGRPCPPLPGYLTFHIGQIGRRASHRFLYCIEPNGTVFVLRLLHDHMDFVRHLPPH